VNGKIVKLNLIAKKAYGFIECPEFDYKLYFQIPSGITLEIGDEVSFGTASSDNDKNTLKAINVNPGHTSSSPSAANDSNEQKQRYYLPKDTAELLFSSSGVVIENIALKLHKYMRQNNLQKPISKPEAPETYSDIGKELVRRRQEIEIDILRAFKYHHSLTGTLGSRMVLGLGGANVQETSMTFHHIYACPYVPGSAIKGCLRSYVMREFFDGEEKKAEKDSDFKQVFGSQESRGKILFLDAFPKKIESLDIDIMNPHYPKYYSGIDKPTDNDSPNPIKFYAVPEKTIFVFRLVSKKIDPKTTTIKEVALPELVKTTLEDMGIGAKTAVGYGWFGI
jgi:CRISPR-associated protein Cmr6